MGNKDRIGEAAGLIAKSRRVVALTGAGVSAESGISTYRDAGGLWDRYPEGSSGGILAVMANHPEDAPKILMDFLNGMKGARPNPGHLALAELEKMGYLRAVITQNVDNLHKQAGNSKILQMHGSLYRLRCLKCGKKETLDRKAYFEMFERMIKKMKRFTLEEMASSLPSCSCGGRSRPDFVAFGEPVQDLPEAMEEAKSCDLMLILGTSGVVHPAASLPGIAKSHGSCLIEINPKESVLTEQCDLFLKGQTGVVMPQVVSFLRKELK